MSSVDSEDPFDLSRFVKAQARDYEIAFAELRASEKHSHWMWFIFPQLRGLGHSSTAAFYGITSLNEARAYLAHPILGVRLRECVRALLDLHGSNAEDVLGATDALKLRSSLTLFGMAAPKDALFQKTLEKYFGGEQDSMTLRLLQQQ